MSTPTVGQTIMAGPLATTFLVTGDMVGGAYCVVRQTVRVGQLFVAFPDRSGCLRDDRVVVEQQWFSKLKLAACRDGDHRPPGVPEKTEGQRQ